MQTLRSSVARLKEQLEQGSQRGADLQAMLRLLLDLGDLPRVSSLLDRHAAQIDPQEGHRLRAEMALRTGDYPRAAEHLLKLGASRALAYAASRAGDFALAARTLETLSSKSADPAIEVSLARVYRDQVAADLMGGKRRLLGETNLIPWEGTTS